MKAKHLISICVGITAAFISCKEKTVQIDSEFITVSSPTPRQVINDSDSVDIDFVIKPQDASVTKFLITVTNKHGKTIFSSQQGCDCKSQSEVTVHKAFLYDVEKTMDVSVLITAVLDNGKELREKIPIVLHE
nr:hypothetical protein [uncultured Dyadobacter sp.]